MTISFQVSVAAASICRYPSIDACRTHVEALVSVAASAGSALVVLPELLCVGLLWTDPAAAETDAVRVGELYRRTLNPLLQTYQEMLSDLASRHELVIAGASYWHERDGTAVNTAFWCQPDGSVEWQDKLHPTRPEQAINTVGGNQLRVFELHGVRVGMVVCYDVQFPELIRPLVDSGVELLVVPSLTDARGYWRVRHCAHARAIENQMFVCVSPLIGNLGIPRDRPAERHGAPLVLCPIDNRFGIEDGTLAQGKHDVEGLAHAVLDFGVLRRSREKSEIMHLKDRRPELYTRPVHQSDTVR